MATTTTTRAPSGAMTFAFGILCLVIFAGILVAWVKSSGPRVNQAEKERADARVKRLNDFLADQQSKLSTTGWVDKDKGVVQIPIEAAMKLVVNELHAKKKGPSQVKVPEPAPLPARDPKSTEPPPPALPSAPQGADTIHFTAPAIQTAAPAAVPAQAAPAQH